MVSVWIRWFSVGVGGFAGSLTDPPSCVEFRSLSLSKKTKFGGKKIVSDIFRVLGSAPPWSSVGVN